MASGKPAPDASALPSTRQMLDELDALMERMLALPVSDAPEPLVPASQPAAPPATKSPILSATLTLLQAPTDEAQASHPPTNPSHLPARDFAGTPAPPYQAEPKAGLPELTALARPAEPAPLSDRAVPPSAVPQLDALLAEVPEPPTTAGDWFILPVIWGNRLFDRGTMLLGEHGDWLRSPAGRSMLGLTGVGLLLAALAWLLRDWLGWTW
jgi:hypothetical protein